jgi:osmotically-inducible protein OsmY
MSNGNEKLRDRVLKRITDERELAECGIQVEVERRVVTLRGALEDARLRALAERVAREAAGAAEVRTELTVKGDIADERGPMATEFGSQEAAAHESASTGFDRLP